MVHLPSDISGDFQQVDETSPEEPKIAYANRQGAYVLGHKATLSNMNAPGQHGNLDEGEGSLGEEVAAEMVYFWDELRETDPFFNLEIVKWELSHYMIPRVWSALFGLNWKLLPDIATEQVKFISKNKLFKISKNKLFKINQLSTTHPSNTTLVLQRSDSNPPKRSLSKTALCRYLPP